MGPGHAAQGDLSHASPPSRHLLARLRLEGAGFAVERGQEVLGIEGELALALVDRVADAQLAHAEVVDLLREVLADSVDRVADEHRLDEAEPVVAVGERVQAVRRREPEP
jgi:hypothetical protein